MKRNIELFLKKGKIHLEATKTDYGRIVIQDPYRPDSGESLMVFTMYDHSFTNRNRQPKKGTVVFFFLIPLEYIVVLDVSGPGGDSPLLAVNVTDKQKVMKSTGPDRFHPCNTMLTIQSDAVSANYAVRSARDQVEYEYYGIDDYGELTLISVNSSDKTSYPRSKKIRKGKLEPWDKIVCEDTDGQNSSRKSSSKRLEVRGPRDKIEFKLLKMKFKMMDPKWKWVNLGKVKKTGKARKTSKVRKPIKVKR